MNLTETKDFIVHTKSLKEVRVFSREVFDKLRQNGHKKQKMSYFLGFSTNFILYIIIIINKNT